MSQTEKVLIESLRQLLKQAGQPKIADFLDIAYRNSNWADIQKVCNLILTNGEKS